MINNEDKKLREIFKAETEQALDQKEDTWNRIQQELFEKQKKPVQKGRFAARLGAIAAAVMLIILSTSLLSTEQAGEQQPPAQQPDQQEYVHTEKDVPIEDQYEQEIQVEREVEGQREVIDLELFVHAEEDYIIYIDPERYEVETSPQEMKIVFTEADDAIYPETGISIRKYTDDSKENVIAQVTEEIRDENMVVVDEKDVSKPFEAYELTAYSNENPNAWNSPVDRYYIHEVETEQDLYFVWKQMLFTEGMEGQSSGLNVMLQTFKYVGNDSLEDVKQE